MSGSFPDQRFIHHRYKTRTSDLKEIISSVFWLVYETGQDLVRHGK